MINEPVAVTLLVTQVLEALQIPYLIGGSIASIIHGEYRATNDADLLADVHPQHVAPLVQALSPAFLIRAEDLRAAIRYAAQERTDPHVRPSFSILHTATAFKVDVFLVRERPFERSELARRVHALVAIDPEQRAYVATAEDMILAKLEWYELGNRVSDQQWRDLLAMLKVQGVQLDMAYLRRWAGALGVSDLLEQALRDAGLDPAP